MMKIIFWNVRGLGDRTKRCMVAEVLRDNGTDIFCLEETKLVDPPVLFEHEIALNRNFKLVFKNTRGASGGLVIGVNSNCYEILDFSAGTFTLSITVRQKTDRWTQRVTVTYGPNHRDSRGAMWREIQDLARQNTVPWVIGVRSKNLLLSFH